MKEHLTAKIISKTQKFSINIPDTELLEKIKYCGSVSGMDKNKSQVFEVLYGKNDVPMISKCPVNMNCKVYETIDTKDMLIFMAEVMELYSDEECLFDNQLIVEKIDPIICTIQGKFYNMGNEIG